MSFSWMIANVHIDTPSLEKIVLNISWNLLFITFSCDYKLTMLYSKWYYNTNVANNHAFDW
jgi:hypothetical protein